MTRNGTGKVLFMDDDEMIRDVSSTMLQYLGYEVTTAQEGEEAIGLYFKAKEEGNPFDLVMMDLIIHGGMGGLETIKIMHALAPDVKFIVASGYTDGTSLSDLREYGVNGFLRKPYTIPDLNKILSEVIQFGSDKDSTYS